MYVLYNESILVFLRALLFTARKRFWHNNFFTKIDGVLANKLN